MKLELCLCLVLLCTGALGQTIPQPSSAPVAFCATRRTNVTTGTSLLMFDDVTVNDGNEPFDLTDSSFQVPANSGGGYFWLSWTVGIPGDQQANVALLGESRAPNIIRRHTAFTGGPDTTTRFELISLNAFQSGKLTLSTDFPLYSDAGLQISFLGFGLLNTMNNVVGFSVGRSGVTSAAGTIRYDLINEDTHLAYNVTTGQYVVPLSGPYVLAITSSPVSNYTFAITLNSGSNLITTLYMYDTAHYDIDTLGTTVMVNLNQGDRISTSLTLGPLYSDIRYTTSFQGFLYSPTGIIPLSWSVANEQTYTGLVDPVPFDVVFLNQGAGWDIVQNSYRVRDAGVFYIQMTAGLGAGYPTRMELLLNGSPQSAIYRESTAHNGVDTRSRAMILRLVTDDQLRIRLPAGYRLYGNANRVTKFSGFRIYA